ncbi:MAG: hypothetical protein NC400_00475 [Clostridium sp.]|nr:hypothetical protein [Clostridium sp.]
MAAFFPDLLEEFLGSDFLLTVCRKFHYEEERLSQLRAVAEKMLPFMRGEAFWERGKFGIENERGIEKKEKAFKYEAVVMSLGGGIDALQETYHKEGLLTESYMLEALADELLLQGCKAYNCYMEENGGYYVAGYHFPGSGGSFPLETLPELLKGFEHTGHKLTCNKAFCMSPQKSVAFVAELTKDRKARCGSICADCDNKDCPNRAD